MKIQLENAKLMEDCIEAAQKLIQYPNFNSLKDKYPIEDEDFWAALNDNWSMSIESVFYQENLDYLYSSDDLKRTKQFIKEYEDITGKEK